MNNDQWTTIPVGDDALIVPRWHVPAGQCPEIMRTNCVSIRYFPDPPGIFLLPVSFVGDDALIVPRWHVPADNARR